MKTILKEIVFINAMNTICKFKLNIRIESVECLLKMKFENYALLHNTHI